MGHFAKPSDGAIYAWQIFLRLLQCVQTIKGFICKFLRATTLVFKDYFNFQRSLIANICTLSIFNALQFSIRAIHEKAVKL